MAVIGMIGPHAIGKTTAALRWLDRYGDKLTVAFADCQREKVGHGELVWVKEWKGSKQEKANLARLHQQSNKVTLIESARGFSTWLDVFAKTDPVIVLTCSEPDGRKFIEERRASKGKPKQLSPYWTVRRLEYECGGYLLNFADKRLHPAQVHHFNIEDRERDWKSVDECFSRIFRKLYNQVHRRVTGIRTTETTL